MAINPEEEVVLTEEKGHVRLITLNQPRKLNVISSKVVYLLAQNLEKWEKDEDANLVIIKGAGRAFSAGGDLKMFYDGRKSKDQCLEVVYRFYWLCYHIHTYKKPQVALVHGISMGGGASLMVPMKFSVVTEKTVFATPEASIGFHTDCSFSYILSRLPGRLGTYSTHLRGCLGLLIKTTYLLLVFEYNNKLFCGCLRQKSYTLFGFFDNPIQNKQIFRKKIEENEKRCRLFGGFVVGEYFALTGARLSGEELVAAGLVTHLVPLDKLSDLENRLVSLNSGDESAVKAAIEEFSLDVQINQESVLHKREVIDECFSKDSVEEILESFEAVSKKEGNGWIVPVLKGLKRSSPTGLKITLKSIRDGRKQTLSECLKKEFRLTINILRSVISGDVYEGIRALTIDKDNSPKWDPLTLGEVDSKKLDLVFQPFEEASELNIPENEEQRWTGKYEDSVYA